MYLVCDIDGTLSVEPEVRVAAAAEEDWDRYYAQDFTSDAPKPCVLSLVEAWLSAGGIALFVTSRRDTVRDETWFWLRRHLPSMHAANSTLVMRRHDDCSRPLDYKVANIVQICPKATAALVIDDDPAVCRGLSEIGYTVLEVR